MRCEIFRRRTSEIKKFRATSVPCANYVNERLNRATMTLKSFLRSPLLLLIFLVSGIIADDETAEANADANANDEDSSPDVSSKKRITLLGLEDIIQRSVSGDKDNPRLNYEELHVNDLVEDSFFDPFAPDSSCLEDDESESADCWHPPSSTVDEEVVEVTDEERSSGLETLAWGYGGDDPDDVRDSDEDEGDEQSTAGTEERCDVVKGIEQTHNEIPECKSKEKKSDDSSPTEKHKVLIDKHWGSDPNILRMRDRLRGTRSRYWDWIEQQKEDSAINATNHDTTNQTYNSGRHHKSKSNQNNKQSQRRPPVFLLPGLASTRLVSWKHKPCPQSALLSDIKMLDYVWLNMNLLIQMATIDVRCWSECMTLGKFQRDYDDDEPVNGTYTNDQQSSRGCKLRPDEGLDAISSLAPGSISSSFFVGGTNTVYAWLIQWLADNLGYDVSSIVALPYDWRRVQIEHTWQCVLSQYA